MNGFVMWLTAESGVHAGGDESIGTIDEPIQRNGITGLPVIHGQSLKGAERRFCRSVGARLGVPLEGAFGSAPPGAASEDGLTRTSETSQGWMDVGEAQLVAFPVPTFRRRFMWVTSPIALDNVLRCLQLGGDPAGTTLNRFAPLDEGTAYVTAGGGWPNPLDVGDFTIDVDESKGRDVDAWAAFLAARLPSSHVYFRQKLPSDLAVVADEVLSDLTVEFAELSARVQLGEKVKEVAAGPFYSEYLPSGTLMCAWHGTRTDAASARSLRAVFDDSLWTVGGDESIGKGLVWSTTARSDESRSDAA